MLFDTQADQYLQFRPSYPPEAAAAVAEFHSLAAGKSPKYWRQAVDVAAGSGQASWCLTPFFEQVVASDASEQQVARGRKRVHAAITECQEVSAPKHTRSATAWFQDGKPLEIHHELIAKAQSACQDPSRITFSVGSSERLPLPDNSVDLTM